MALPKLADGILRTNVSWDDLQDAVCEAFGSDAEFGPNKDVEDIGFVNVSNHLPWFQKENLNKLSGLPIEDMLGNTRLADRLEGCPSEIRCQGIYGTILRVCSFYAIIL